MQARKPLALAAAATAALLTLAGCFTAAPDTRTGNQGGSTPLSLGAKLLGIQQGTADLTDLNPDDLQLMADLTADITGLPIPEVSDELAWAATEIIKANDLRTFDDLAALSSIDPEDVVIPDGVERILIQEVQALFGNIAEPTVVDEIVARHAPQPEV